MNVSEAMSKLRMELDSKPKCKGLFFRGRTNTYYNYETGKLDIRKSLTLLKRDSCKGYPDCDSYDEEKDNILNSCCDHWMLEEMNDMMDVDAVIVPEIEDGALYGLKVSNLSTDWETGYVNDYTFEFYEILPISQCKVCGRNEYFEEPKDGFWKCPNCGSEYKFGGKNG